MNQTLHLRHHAPAAEYVVGIAPSLPRGPHCWHVDQIDLALYLAKFRTGELAVQHTAIMRAFSWQKRRSERRCSSQQGSCPSTYAHTTAQLCGTAGRPMTVILLAMLLTAQSTPSAFALPSPERRNTTTKWDFNDPQHREFSSTNANKAGVSLVRTTPRHFTHPTCNNNPPSFDCDTSSKRL